MAFCTLEDKEEHYGKHFSAGMYTCSKCGYELFDSKSKFEHDSIWPAFKQLIHDDSVKRVPEEGRPGAIWLFCGKCEGELGHEFQKDRDDGGSRF